MLEIAEDEADCALFKVKFTPEGATVSFYYKMDDQTHDDLIQEYLTLIHGITAAISNDPDYLYKLGEMVNFGRALMYTEKMEEAAASTGVDSADLSNVTFHPSLNRTKH